MKTSVFSLLLNLNVFITPDENIYGLYFNRVNFPFFYCFNDKLFSHTKRNLMTDVHYLPHEALDRQHQIFVKSK